MYMPRRLLVGLLGFAVMTAGVTACRSQAPQDITKILTVSDAKTGWYDAGVENGLNKLVPSVVLILNNAGGEPISNVQLNAVIRRVGETEEWGGAYVKVIGAVGLPPGASTKPVVLRSNLGYTGIEPRAQMLKNKQFVDAQVQVFVKHGGEQWVKLGEWPVARELLTQ
jgi:hypothetical protein